MRQRRHVNGNSNAGAAVDASVAVGWGSGRSVPANITSTSKRSSAGSVMDSVLSEPSASNPAAATAKHEKRSGAATARRPQSSSLRDPLGGSRPTRRVQSARGAGESSRQLSEVKGKAAPESDSQSHSDTSLPKLQPQTVDVVAPAVRKDKNRATAGSHRKPTPPPLVAAASGIDAASQVQWAVKVAPAAPASRAGQLPESAELKDLRRLLRDRYGEKRSVRQAFLTWDSDKDGRLCVADLRHMLTQLGFAQALGGEKVDAILQHVAETPAGSLNYDDFCGLVYGSQELNESCTGTTSKRQAAADEDGVPTSDPDCVIALLRAKYETRRVHQVFRSWDIDKSGGVTLAEIESNLRRQGLRIAKPQLMKLFDTYDLNHDGRLLYDEFMRLVYGPVHEQRYSYLAAQRRKRQQERELDEGDPLDFFRGSAAASQQATHSTDDPGFRATLQRKLQTFSSRLNDAYAAFDNDHSGNLSYRELCQGLQQLGINLTEREFLHLATRVDTDGNGEISFKEFCDVFGGGDGSNRRRSQRTNSPGDEADDRVEQRERESKPRRKDNNQRRRAAGTFDFSHLTRRTKIPTRCGRTPFTSSEGIISGNQDGTTDPARFTTEAQLYGSGSFSRSAEAATATLTLGQEEKQRRDAANVKRLQRLRGQMEHYEAQARPAEDTYTLAQERRVRTLQRHQERYRQRIEEQRPKVSLSPARKGIQVPHQSSTR